MCSLRSGPPRCRGSVLRCYMRHRRTGSGGSSKASTTRYKPLKQRRWISRCSRSVLIDRIVKGVFDLRSWLICMWNNNVASGNAEQELIVMIKVWLQAGLLILMMVSRWQVVLTINYVPFIGIYYGHYWILICICCHLATLFCVNNVFLCIHLFLSTLFLGR